MGVQKTGICPSFVQKENNQYIYHFIYKDHLGNNRLTYADVNGDGEVTPGEIIEENNYYPFGLKHQGYNELAGDAHKYKFLNREHQPELGLNTIATDYRHYDAALGRFNNMDALSELAYGQTPYRYGFNNPVYWTDPTGLFESRDDAHAFAKEILNLKDKQYNIEAYDDGTFVLNVTEGEFDGRSFYFEMLDSNLDELVIATGGSGSENSSRNLPAINIDGWTIGNSSADGFGAFLRYRSNTQAGSFRLFKNLENGKVWAPKYYKNNFGVRGRLKHKTFNVSKTIAKGTKVTSALLEVTDIVDGVKADQGIGRNTITQTAGAVGGVWGGIWLGSKAGAAMSAGTTNPYIIGGAVIVGGFVGGIAGETAAEALIESIPSSNYNPDRPVILHKR